MASLQSERGRIFSFFFLTKDVTKGQDSPSLKGSCGVLRILGFVLGPTMPDAGRNFKMTDEIPMVMTQAA